MLLYADDLVILAECQEDLQRAFDALGDWAATWHFSFGIGPEKSAVLPVGTRRQPAFTLQGQPVPCVLSYRYLGVVFQSSRSWQSHVSHVIIKGQQRFYLFLSWAENQQLDVSFRVKLFETYVCMRVA